MEVLSLSLPANRGGDISLERDRVGQGPGGEPRTALVGGWTEELRTHEQVSCPPRSQFPPLG